MSCTYNYKGKEYTQQELETAIRTNSPLGQDLKKDLKRDPDTFYDPIEVVPSPYANYINFKTALVEGLKNRLSKIKRQKKKAKPNEIKDLIRLETTIKNRLEGDTTTSGLVSELNTLQTLADINAMEQFVVSDMNRLENLSKSNNPDDLKEARSIINFYNQMGKIDDTYEEHPVFTREQRFFNDGSPRFTPEKIAVYKAWATQAAKFDGIITEQERSIIKSTINATTNVQKVYGVDGLSYDEIINSGKLKDINWADMMLMDITGGIFSTNGVIPQVMQTIIQEEFEKQLVNAKEFEEKLEAIQDKVEKILKEMDGGIYNLSRKFPLMGGVSYDLFQQIDKDNYSTGKLVHRHTPKFFDVRKAMLFTFSRKMAEANAQTDPQAKSDLIAQAYEWRQGWYRENTVIIDVSKLGDDLGVPDANRVDDGGAHKAELLELLGEQGYREEIAKQKEQLEKYEQEAEVWKESYLNQVGVTNEADLNESQKKYIEMWENTNSPLKGINHFYNYSPVTINGKKIVPNMRFNLSVPRKKLAKVEGIDTSNNYIFKDTGTESEYYDKNYQKISENETLLEFLNLITEMNRKIIDNLPAELQDSVTINSLPGIRKGINEILLDKNLTKWQSISKAAKELIDKIKKMFTMDIQSSMSKAQVDTITGKPNYRVNDSFIRKNHERLSTLFKVEAARVRQMTGTDVNKFTFITKDKMNPALWSTVATLLQTDVATVKKRYKEKVPIGNILQRATQHKVAQENSFDLPKVMKYYSTMAAQYAARNEVLPLLEAMKSHYEQIKNPSTNNVNEAITNAKTGNTRLEGFRANATRQMEDWFERVVLGNYGTKHAGVAKAVEDSGIVDTNKMNNIANKFTFSKKVLLSEDKKLKAELDKLVANEPDPEKQAELQKMADELGRNRSMTSMVDGLLNWVRFIGLGFNISSSITNYVEGQTSNMIIASSGDFFKPELIYPATAAVRNGGLWKAVSLGKFSTEGGRKSNTLMNRYRIIQDSSNELQKASGRSTLKKWTKFLSPYELTRRVEGQNQAPLMVALMMDTMISNPNGDQISVWDAMDEHGKLKGEFATEENKANWEDADGQAYRDFKGKVEKMIDTAHGNYSELRGMMAKSSTLGKIAVMFKTWMTRAIYGRFATKQDDLQAGIKGFKGRYHSHTPASATILAGMAGLAAFGGVGAIAGMGAGLLLGNTYGVRSDLGFAKEMLYNIKAMGLKAMGVPINMVAGKEVIKTSNYNEFIGTKFTERDAANMRSNLTELSLLLSYIALQLMVKATWDVEDEEEKATHNLLVNRLMQFSGQTTAYINPVDFASTVTETPFIRFVGEVGKTIDATGKWLAGNDIIPTGQNAGESKLYNQIEKIGLPGPARAGFGFEGQTERQYEASGFDSWFMSDEKRYKKMITGQRARRKLELEAMGLSDKVIRKKLSRELPTKMPEA